MNGPQTIGGAGSETPELRSLVLVLEEGAVAFCNYVNPAYGAAQPRWMPLPVLNEAIRFAQRRSLRLICVVGRCPLPRSHTAVLARFRPVYIAPANVPMRSRADVRVLEPGEVAVWCRRPGRLPANVILRLDHGQLSHLAEWFSRLAGKVKRLNVALFDVGAYGEKELAAYPRQLDRMGRTIASLAWPWGGTECNLITDRLMLREMNNCDAGVKHLTVAPDGRFYLCPGFYHQAQPAAVGSLESGLDVRNPQLLTLDRAPICRRCDAYHCRRCLLLNRQLTSEINTPSRQQCVTAHCEREASRRLVQRFERGGHPRRAAPGVEIPRLDYLDPMDSFNRKEPHAQEIQ